MKVRLPTTAVAPTARIARATSYSPAILRRSSFSCQFAPSYQYPSVRTLSTTATAHSNSSLNPNAHSSSAAKPFPSPPTARWLSETKARIGRCILFGLSREQAGEAAEVLGILGREWRELVAGREGFLVGRKRAGLLRHKVVWGEMDCMNHVNNVTYTRYAESARINWAYNYAIHVDPTHKKEWSELWTPNGDGLILRSIRTDYKFPMAWPDHISVFHKLSSLPASDSSAFILDVVILSELHQRPAARCVEDIVVYDYKKGKKTAIRPFMMSMFEQTWEEQEEEKRRVEARVKEVEGMIERLELGSWASGKEEDMGSAGR